MPTLFFRFLRSPWDCSYRQCSPCSPRHHNLGLHPYRGRGSSRLDLPVLYPQTTDPRELAGVVSHEREVVRERNRGDLNVVGADRGALAGEVGADLRCVVGGSVVEGERRKSVEEMFELRRRGGGIGPSQYAEGQFSADDRANRKIFRARSGESLDKSTNQQAAEVVNARVAVEQVSHQNSSRFSKLSGPGRSLSGKSGMLPAVWWMNSSQASRVIFGRSVGEG